MASWMVHLRVADKLLSRIRFLDPVAFVVGNIAPDSGVPNEDWSAFMPSTKISHFKTANGKKADPEAFAAKYFLPCHQVTYNAKQYSFYLGYLVHLMTDTEWSKRIVHPAMDKFAEEKAADPEAFIWKMKEDWYDLDFLYLRDHPAFRSFLLYSQAVGFENTYMEEFSADAFDNRREYITGFYLQKKDNLDRTYPYLTKEEMDAFVEVCSRNILQMLRTQHGLSVCPEN